MSSQLTLDALGGIDWDHPTLEQLEQFAHDYMPRSVEVSTVFVERKGMCVVVSERNMVMAWMKPQLVRTALDTLEWVVLLKEVGTRGYAQLRSDAELEAALAAVFEGE